jgi:hypothetical protein
MRKIFYLVAAVLIAQNSAAPPPGPSKPVVAPATPVVVKPDPVYVPPPSGPSAGPSPVAAMPDLSVILSRISALEAEQTTIEASQATLQAQILAQINDRLTALEARMAALEKAPVVTPSPVVNPVVTPSPVAPTPVTPGPSPVSRGYAGKLWATLVYMPSPLTDAASAALMASAIASDLAGSNAVWNTADITETQTAGSVAAMFSAWTAKLGANVVYLTDETGQVWATLKSPTHDEVVNRVAAIRQGKMR